jgi:hypothetical protein
MCLSQIGQLKEVSDFASNAHASSQTGLHKDLKTINKIFTGHTIVRFAGIAFCKL